MISIALQKYFDATQNREIRPDLRLAVSLIGENKVAIDCGCGAGADIAYLVDEGFKVYGFDIEAESISRCTKRFGSNKNVVLSEDTFSAFDYPKASLVVADASLFFCPKAEFADVWGKITECLYAGGVFCGSFLGPEDTMAGPDYDGEAFWNTISVFTEPEVKALFSSYQVERFVEHKTSGTAPHGEPHNWHIFSVVAKKV